MEQTDGYFDYGPVDQAGRYSKARGALDGVVGFFDGLASVTNSVGNVIRPVTDISDDIAESRALWDDVQLDREEREQGMLLDAFKVERGDNVKLYFVAGAALLVGVLLIAR